MVRLTRGIRSASALALLGVLVFGIGACAQKPDPVETRESLEQVASDPEPEPGEYDFEAYPDPIVEPLECTPVLVITVRGTGEPSRGQLLSPVARQITEALPDSVQTVDADYPASTEVNSGGTKGVRWLLDTLRVQTQTCPLQRFVLLGYSQGALVIGDALDEPAARVVGLEAGEMPTEAAPRIAAMVLYGNPRFVGEEPYNVGGFSPTTNGIMPRTPGALEAYADRIRDYCEATDFICQATFNIDESGHVAYYDNGAQQQGAAFVITLLAEKPADESSGASDGDPEPQNTEPSDTEFQTRGDG